MRLIIAILLLLPATAYAQHDHDQHHAFYQGWINKLDKGCCNDQDCGLLRDEDERQASVGIEVRIEGKWCPVKPFHYLKKGNAPDWSSAHVCVQKRYADLPPADPCDRLLCYQPRPGI